MPKLPVITGRETVKAFEKDGWVQDLKKRSYVILIKEGSNASLSIPLHKVLAPGTLRLLIRASGMTIADFIDFS